jgi:hypothetical protein
MDIQEAEDESARRAAAELECSARSLELGSSIRRTMVVVRSTTIDQVCRPDLGDLSFVQLRGEVGQALRLAREIDLTEIEYAPPSLLADADQHLGEMRNVFERAKTFSLKRTDYSGFPPVQEQPRIARELGEATLRFSGVAAPLAAYTSARALAPGTNAGAVLQGTLRDLEEIRRQAKIVSGHIEAMEKASEVATRKTGTSATQSHYQLQANEHSVFSKVWLVAAVLTFAATAVLAGFIYHDALERATAAAADITPMKFAQLSVVRILVLSVAATVAVWCGRSYKAHRHNYVVNKQRLNALATFEAFVASTSDPATKSAVLLQAMASIFALQRTGYDSTDGDGVAGPQVVELIKPVIEAGQKA